MEQNEKRTEVMEQKQKKYTKKKRIRKDEKIRESAKESLSSGKCSKEFLSF